MPAKPKLKLEESKFYNEEDSDNESDFEVRYEQEEDRFDDLVAIKKPMFLKELAMGLQSDNYKK
jgi:hypothetical protein